MRKKMNVTIEVHYKAGSRAMQKNTVQLKGRKPELVLSLGGNKSRKRCPIELNWRKLLWMEIRISRSW
jgi:hypothetical protein